VPNAFQYTNIDLQDIGIRSEAARGIVAGFSTAMPSLAEFWRFIEGALNDVPVLSAEIKQLAGELRQTRLDRANLVAAARATIAAHHDGESDPLSYLRDELDARASLPPDSRGRA
jgi:hypothetical protein